jgi:lipopolysaccharide heptosyltransferase I
MPRVPLREVTARRIALVKPSALGDIVHALPVLSALRVRFPAARVTWVVNRSYESLLAGHPDLDATLPFDRAALGRGPMAALRAAGEVAGRLRRGRFDLVIDLQCLLRTGLMCLATGARRRVGLADAREGASLCYTDRIDIPAGDTHAIDRYWRVAEALGVGSLPKRFVVPLRSDAVAWADTTLARLPRPLLAFGVGARWVTKRWPPAHFAVLARRAWGRAGAGAVFVGSADETAAARQVAEAACGPCLDLTGRTTLPQLAAVLAACDGMVGNDTGPLHLAAALGVPVVAPYTCTKPARHGPYGQTGGIASGVHCHGSYVKTCPRLECMSELTPDRLLHALDALLARPGRRGVA